MKSPDDRARWTDRRGLSDGRRPGFEAAAPSWTIVTADGKPSIILQIKQQQDGNTFKSSLTSKPRSPPMPRSCRPISTSAIGTIQSGAHPRLGHGVLEAVLIGIALAAVVLLAFLRDFKITIITLIVVPAVLAATVLLLPCSA